MKNRLLIILLTIYFMMTSCATIMNKTTTRSTVYTTAPAKIFIENDTLTTVDNKVDLLLKRSNNPIEITIKTDTLVKRVSVNPINSFAYKSNIYNYGLGLIVDYNSPKRYKYPTKIYLTPENSLKTVSFFGEANNKGELLLHISIPYINTFLFKPENELKKAGFGFMGLSAGFDYYHSKKQFISLSASTAISFELPFPVPINYASGEQELFSSNFLSLSNNHKMGRFSQGYGIAFSRNIWKIINHGRPEEQIPEELPSPEESPDRESVVKGNNAWGLLFSSYHQTGQNFNIGLIYRPTFIRLNTYKQFQYEHLISIDLAWRILLKR